MKKAFIAKDEVKPFFKKIGSIYVHVTYIFLIVIIGVTFYLKENTCVVDLDFINKDIACGKSFVVDKKGYASTQKDLEEYIKVNRSTGEVSEVSVYFRDLVNGPVFGIREFDNFAPASLLKLPFALTYLKESEEIGPEMLNQSLLFTGDKQDFNQNFVPEETLEVGGIYTIEDLLRRMLSYSDNNSSNLLAAQLESTGRKDIIRETLLELGILAPDDPFDQVVSVRRYASIFRGLYNVSFINKENSNKVLGWLAQSKFKNGLVAGVPESVKVAHKFGERFLEDGTRQLHDCGIVYYPENPYLLCVMTHGSKYESLEKTIQHVSNLVYKEVDSRKF